jgi:hypothetical protein
LYHIFFFCKAEKLPGVRAEQESLQIEPDKKLAQNTAGKILANKELQRDMETVL